MSRIQIDISKVRSCNEDLRRNNLKISNIARDIFLSMGSIDSRIQARRNIGSRLKNACDECNKIEQKLTKLQKFISNSMDRYEKAERKVENESEELIALWNLRMETLVELKSMVGILGTSSSYIENAKMFYDGEKVGDDDDEDTEEILEETDELLKEVNEEDDNDWTRQPAKEDIFDKFADWITEKVTGEKASPKTQGEEVIDAQLTTMSFDEQSILADIASDYQTAFRGLASADRINEALENFEEEPVFSSGNSVNEVSQAELNTCDSIKKIINDKGCSVDEFAQLLHPDRVLSASEKLLVNSVRKEIGLPSADTLMCKAIPQSDIYKYLYNEYGGVRGFTAVEEHGANLKTLLEKYNGERLDYNNTAFKTTPGVDGFSKPIGLPDKFYGALEYKVNDVDKISIPNWKPKPDDYPYTGRAFTGSTIVVLPEYYQSVREFVSGDKLKILDSTTGDIVQQFIYDKKLGWLELK